MQHAVVDVQSRQAIKELELSDLFAADFKESLIHQVVNAYLAGGRSGTKAQKNRSDVRGGGAKPWRQKGTGRARAGTTRGPLWRTGGVTFAARPRSFEQKVNKKMYRGAMVSIISELLRQGRMHIVEDIKLDSCKTKEVSSLLSTYNDDGARLLLITDKVTDELYLGGRNISWLDICSPELLDPVTLIQASNIVVTEAAIKQLEVQWSCK